MRALFAYGSLMIPEVIQTLTGRDFRSVQALAVGYDRFVVRGRPYPGLVRRPGASTVGRVYFDLDEESLEVLDRFEADECYEREEIVVRRFDEPADRLAPRGMAPGAPRSDRACEIPVLAYVVPEAGSAVLSNEPWSEERFRAVYLANFLQLCGGFYSSPQARLRTA